MASNKYVAWGFVVVFVAALAFGGYEFWTHRSKSNLNYGVGSVQAGQSDSSYNNGSNIPLNQAGSNGLSTDSSPTGNLGQLSAGSGGSSGASSTEQGIPSSGSSSNSSNSSGSSGCNTQAINPSTFGQYNQYQNQAADKGPLFGEVCVGTGTALSTTSGSNQATVYYKGWLTDGTLFDESHADSSGNLQTFSFTEGQHQVISGWEEGLLGMKAGGVRLLVIPPSLGYGANGQGSIPGNSVLVFEVQLVSVN